MREKGLLERLKNGGTVTIAEGYLWELERRGFVKHGMTIPEVVLSKPDEVRILHEEFALAGSDVMEAFTYFGHREMMKKAGREADLEKLNRNAMSIAREVADKYDKLLAGGLSNSLLYNPKEPETHIQTYDMFKEQVLWAVESGADYIIGETFDALGEAELALRAIKEFGKGLPAVITLVAHVPDCTTDDVPIPEACKRLEEQGADVIGLNCSRGPEVMLPMLREIKQACKVPLAALPVPYRTTDSERTFYKIKDPKTGKNVYPSNLDVVRCSRDEIRQFAVEAKELGVQYIGLCCGNYPSLFREVAEVYDKDPPASKYSQANTYILGSKPVSEHYQKVRRFMNQ